MNWGKPGNSRKFHIFNGMRSLCMKWMCGGADQAVKPDLIVKMSPGDCAECVRHFNATLPAPKKGGAAS